MNARLALSAGAALLALAGCGSDTPHIPQAAGATPVVAADVTMQQTGDQTIRVDPASVTFGLDDARLLVVHVRVTSSAPSARTVAVRVSVFDARGTIVGDATGGAVGLGPGATLPIRLSGPTPTGTIARATFEVTSKPAG